ncbi:MAG: hypothetical protein FIA99_15340 [Ruminiclostridium sp.]|nr:hypothetical protein [Ruminiclostridium sp.]
MVEVYFYLPAGHVANAVECGIKLSDWYSKEIELDGGLRKCISALLNPRDDMKKYMSTEYRCLKMEIMPKYCYIADNLMYQTGLVNSEAMDMYLRTIVPVEKYSFGQFRLPECLVVSTVIGDYVSILDKRLDSPILYDNSEELYVGNIIEDFKEKYDDFNDALLYSFFLKLTENGIYRMINDDVNGTSIFIDNINKKVYTIRIPDLRRY